VVWSRIYAVAAINEGSTVDLNSYIRGKTAEVQPHWCTVKQLLEEEKSKHASLAQQNGFDPAFLHRMLRLAKGTAKPNTCC
jgi:hypothetical protein